MNKNLTFEFTVDKTNKTITVVREFDAEVDFVWDAFTDKELLDLWWAPKPWKAKTKTMDFREGGQWLYAMIGPTGEKHWATTNYIIIKLEKVFVGLDAFADADGNIKKDMPKSKREVKFTNNGKQTLVTIKTTYDDVEGLDTIIKMGYREGIIAALENLDALLLELEK